jgi:tRNA 2-selenouridine synthase
VPQPSQKKFETRIATVLENIDVSKPLYVEGESRRIGKVDVPAPLVARMRAAPCIEIVATPPTRLAYLLRDYAYLGEDRDGLADQLGRLKDLQGKETVTRWQDWALAGELAPLFAELMALHYDPHYGKSQNTHFARWPERQVIASQDLSDAGIEDLARQILLCPA